MDFGISLFNSSIIEKQAVNDIIKCNNFTAKYGLTLTEKEISKLIQIRSETLKNVGRIEIGGGIIENIIKEFCDSSYISKNNYTETLQRLIETFYYYKNETLDLISDDDLIHYMKKSFDGICQGSLELLSGRELYNLAHNLKYGHTSNDFESTEEINYDE